jgi:hypothetical protein
MFQHFWGKYRQLLLLAVAVAAQVAQQAAQVQVTLVRAVQVAPLVVMQ